MDDDRRVVHPASGSLIATGADAAPASPARPRVSVFYNDRSK
jgi:hypothetical protein